MGTFNNHSDASEVNNLIKEFLFEIYPLDLRIWFEIWELISQSLINHIPGKKPITLIICVSIILDRGYLADIKPIKSWRIVPGKSKNPETQVLGRKMQLGYMLL